MQKDVFREKVADLLSKKVKLNQQEIIKILEKPKPEFGDYSFPCFGLAMKERKNPFNIAKELEQSLMKSLPREIEKIEAKGGYINFFINKKTLAEMILKDILKEKEKYGSGNEKGKVALEHTSLNPNSSPHVGRIRNSLIGDFIKNIFEFKGFDVETYYYVNDVSKQIAILALGFKGKESFDDLLSLYVKMNKELEKNPDLEKKVFDLLEKFESKDKKTVALFKKIVGIAVNGQKKILEEFGIKFDKFDYESNYLKEQKNILEQFEKTGLLFKDDEGRMVLNQEGYGLEDKMRSPVLVLARSNGTGLYPLRDIAYTLDKLKRCKRTLVVLGEEQKLYFEQLRAALKILGKSYPEVIHYSYVLIQEGEEIKKMSTRKGDVVMLTDFMKEAREKAAYEIKKRETKGDAKKIGYGAVKYALLKNEPNKNIIFNWEQALNFEGDSGPYLQYAYARASSIVRKSKTKLKTMKIESLSQQEIDLIKKLAEFPEAVEHAYNQLNPSIICNYSLQLSQIFNEFYHACPVISAESEQLKMQRLAMVEAFRIVIKSSLMLLGIEVMNEM